MTANNVLGTIKRLYNWAIENDLYDGPNPANKIKPPKIDNQVVRFLKKDEYDRLQNTLKKWKNQRAALLIKFALYTGIRKGDIFKLIWDDIDFENKFVTLSDTKGKRATIPISKKAFNVLIKSKKIKPNSKWVFANRYGKRRTHFNATWQRIKTKANIDDFRFHDLRHTFASYLISSKKVGLFTLQKLLNHQSSAMTQRYAHLMDEPLRDGANIVDDVF